MSFHNTIIWVSNSPGFGPPDLVTNSFAVTSNEAKAFTAHRDGAQQYHTQAIVDPQARTDVLEQAVYALYFQANNRRLTGDSETLYVQRHREKRGSLGYRVTIYKRFKKGTRRPKHDPNITITGAFPGFIKCCSPPDPLPPSRAEMVVDVDDCRFGFTARKVMWFTGGTWDARSKKHIPFSLYVTPSASNEEGQAALQSFLARAQPLGSMPATSPSGASSPAGAGTTEAAGVENAEGPNTVRVRTDSAALAQLVSATESEVMAQLRADAEAANAGKKRRRPAEDVDQGYEFRRQIMKLACDGASMDQFMKSCVEDARSHNDVGFLFAVDSSKMGAILSHPSNAPNADPTIAGLTARPPVIQPIVPASASAASVAGPSTVSTPSVPSTSVPTAATQPALPAASVDTNPSTSVPASEGLPANTTPGLLMIPGASQQPGQSS